MQAYAEGYELMAATKLITNVTGVHAGVVARHRRAVLAAGPAGAGAQGRPGAGEAQRLRRRLRRGPVDDRGGHPARGAAAGDLRGAVRPVRLAAGVVAGDEGGGRAAPPVRRPRGEAAGPSGTPGQLAGPSSGTGSTADRRRTTRAPAPSRGRRLPVLGAAPSSISSRASPCSSAPTASGRRTWSRRSGYLATLGSHRVAGDAPLVRRGAERAVVRGTVVHAGPGADRRVGDRAGPGEPGAGEPRAGGPAPATSWASCAPCCSRPRTSRWSVATRRAPPVPRRPAGRPPPAVRRRCAPTTTGCSGSASALLKTAGAARAVRAAGRPPHPRRVGRPPRPARCRAAGRRAWSWWPVSPPGRRGVRRGRAVVGADRAASTGPRCDGRAARVRPTTLEPLLLDALARVRRQEVERGVCLVGPHRDDLELRARRPGPAKGYASHGESWALALALRLASYRLLCADGVEPVLILDDVFAELDDRRRRALAGVAARAEQVLVTAAVADDVPAGLTGRPVCGERRPDRASRAPFRRRAPRQRLEHDHPRLWTRLWILWITSARLVMSSGDDRPPILADRPSRAKRGQLSPGLGTAVRRPLAATMPIRTQS